MKFVQEKCLKQSVDGLRGHPVCRCTSCFLFLFSEFCRRTFAGILCDNLPVSMNFRKSNDLKMPRHPFEKSTEADWTPCKDILAEAELNFEEIVSDIVAKN